MKYRNTFILFLLLMPMFAFSHGYWLDITGTGKPGAPVKISIYFGEIDKYGVRQHEAFTETPAADVFRVAVVAPDGQQQTLRLSVEKDGWTTTFTPTVKGTYRILAMSDQLPVVDRSANGGQNVRPIEYLCAIYQIGSSSTLKETPLQFLDIITQRQRDMIQVTAFNNNTICKEDTKLRIFNPDNWEKQLSTDTKGNAEFYPNRKGLYIIRLDWYDKQAGTLNGTGYSATRYRCNYCLKID